MANKRVQHNCLNCDKQFSVYLSWDKQRGGAKYCSIPCRAEASKGIPNLSRLGKSHTEETRQRIRAALKLNPPPGFLGKHSEESKAKMSAAKKGKYVGDKNHAWKGGVTSQNRLERKRFRLELQKKIFIRDRWTCQICFSHASKLHVDHIKRWSDYPELRFDIDNCRTLCVPCHYYITFKKTIPEGLVWAPTTKEQMRNA